MGNDDRDCHVEPVEKPIDPRALERAETLLLAVSGMGCPNCANRVRNAVLALSGVLHVEVDLASGLAAVAVTPGAVDERDLLAAVSTADPSGRHRYRARVLGREGPPTGRPRDHVGEPAPP